MDKKKLSSLIIFIIAIVIVGGISFAWFNYSRTGSENRLVTGDIYLRFDEGTDTISLTNVFPETVEEARSRNDNTLTFSISGINTSNKLLYYEILINKGNEIENKIRFNDSDLRFDLKKIEDNVETMLVENGSYQDINETFMFGEVFGANITSEKVIDYELRMWLSDEVIISDTDPNRTYYASGENAFKNHYASVKLMVIGDFGKEIGTLTYNTDTPITQSIYEGKHIVVNSNNISGLVGYSTTSDGEVVYTPGDVITLNTDTTLYPKYTFNGQIQKLCNNNSITYVQKYNDNTLGKAIDTPDGSGDEDVCYYTTTSSDRNSDAEQNGNVIFGDYCWQIVRTTSDGGVKLLYNGPKTNDGKCPSDADTDNYSSNPRPSTIGFTGTYIYSPTTLTGTKKYGTGFELYNDNGTTKFKLTDVNSKTWPNDYKDIIGKYTCLNTDEVCTTMYFTGYKSASNGTNTVKYTINTTSHYSQIGASTFNVYGDSVALAGYMFNEAYKLGNNYIYPTSTPVIIRDSLGNNAQYYYADSIYWDGTNFRLIDSSTNEPPTSPTSWADIRENVAGMYTCKPNGKFCSTVYYVVANSSNSYMFNFPLKFDTTTNQPETINKEVTWTYGTGVTKSGDTYTLTGTDTLTFKLIDWYSTYSNSQYRNIYVCDDFTSTTCSTAYYIYTTDQNNVYHYALNSYYFANDVIYDANTNTYSYNTNKTIKEIYDFYNQYNMITNTHYICFTYDPVNNTCGANNPIYYIRGANKDIMEYIELNGEPNIQTALVNMLSKDIVVNNQNVTVNKYNSAIKGIVDSWYDININQKSLSTYLDNNTVYCDDRRIYDLGGWSPTGPVYGNVSVLSFKYHWNTDALSVSNNIRNVNFECPNVTDRFSYNNTKAKLTYPVGLLTAPEAYFMGTGYANTGYKWWINTPSYVNNIYVVNRYVDISGFIPTTEVHATLGVRPVITLKPGILVTGSGTYSDPYKVNTSNN